MPGMTASPHSLDASLVEASPTGFLLSTSIIDFQLTRLIPDFDDFVLIPLFVKKETPLADGLDHYMDLQGRLSDEVESDLRVRLRLQGAPGSEDEDEVSVIDAFFERFWIGVTWVFAYKAKITRYGSYLISIQLRGDDIPGTPRVIEVNPG